MVDLKQSVQYIKGVGPSRAKLLNHLGIYTLEDVIEYYPRAYEDRRNIKAIASIEDGETAEIVQESKIDSIIEKGTKVRLGVKTEKINIFDENGEKNLVEGVQNDYDIYKKEA